MKLYCPTHSRGAQEETPKFDKDIKRIYYVNNEIFININKFLNHL